MYWIVPKKKKMWGSLNKVCTKSTKKLEEGKKTKS